MQEEKPTATGEPKETLEVSVVPDDAVISKRIYSNFVAVNQSAYDFSLRFCDASPIHDINKVVKKQWDSPFPCSGGNSDTF